MKLGLFAVAVLAAAVCATTARAAEPGGIIEARLRFDQGLHALQQNDVESARVAFAEAYAAVPAVDILWNLAMTEARSGRHADALAHFRAYVDAPDARPERAARARDALVPALFAQTGHVLVDAPAGAAILMDGRRPLGRAPLGDVVDVEPGPHVLRAEIDGRAVEARVTCAAGELETVTLSSLHEPAPSVLDRAPPPPPPSSPAPPARHAPRAKPVPPPPTPPRPPPSSARFFDTRRVTTITIAGVAASAAVGAVALLATAASDADRAQGLSTQVSHLKLDCSLVDISPCTDLREAAGARDFHRQLGDALLGGAAVLTIGAVVTYLVWPSGAISVSPTKSGATAAVNLRF